MVGHMQATYDMNTNTCYWWERPTSDKIICWDTRPGVRTPSGHDKLRRLKPALRDDLRRQKLVRLGVENSGEHDVHRRSKYAIDPRSHPFPERQVTRLPEFAQQGETLYQRRRRQSLHLFHGLYEQLSVTLTVSPCVDSRVSPASREYEWSRRCIQWRSAVESGPPRGQHQHKVTGYDWFNLMRKKTQLRWPAKCCFCSVCAISTTFILKLNMATKKMLRIADPYFTYGYRTSLLLQAWIRQAPTLLHHNRGQDRAQNTVNQLGSIQREINCSTAEFSKGGNFKLDVPKH
ncbi:hypothetical protein pipiens_012616 [Culex pipiens pipiens]|uniref:Uncharacterized protein n=1 Tax=Culex pipiens pipiens TaxID=38569 RepID=A0ABD1D1K5_CULPP